MSLQEIYIEAINRPDPEDRDRFLTDACGHDDNLREQVEKLIRHSDQVGSFLQQPPGPIAVTEDMPPAVEPPGTQIGPYTLREQIGEGGFGVVYVAEQEKPVARKVALKIIKPGMDTREVIARFEAERQALALMDHPNIAKVLDAGTTGETPKAESGQRKAETDGPPHSAFRSPLSPPGRPYFVMELVKGVPITEFCDERKLNTRDRLALFIDVCRAVQHAHQKGIIHRDLKPSNVMVTLHDDKPVVKVIDFGVAKALSSKLTEKTVYTAYGQMLGTPLYMSPEQAQLSGLDVDTRSDVYSLGVLLYELLTGTTPFDKETLKTVGFDELRRIIREDDPPRPSARISTLDANLLSTVSDKRKVDARKLAASLRGELDWIVMRALEKDRNRRYETASAFAADVERYLADEPVQACPASVWYRFGKFARKNRTTVAMMAMAALMFAALGISGFVVVRQARDEADRKEKLASKRIEINRQAHDALVNLERLTLQAEERGLDDPKSRALVQKAGERLKVLTENELVSAELAKRARSALAFLDKADTTRRIIQRVETIRLNQAATDTEHNRFATHNAIPEYRAVFDEFRSGMTHLSPAQAADVLRHCDRRLQRCLIGALDDWRRLERRFGRNTTESRQRREWIISVISEVDSDPWRNQVREAITKHDLDSLNALAKSVDFATQPPQTLVGIASDLFYSSRKHQKTATSLLTRARLYYPNDFWIHQTLGLMYQRTRRPQYEQAIRCLTAAVAIRPDSAGAWHNLGSAHSRNGEIEEAIACYRKAICVQPEFMLSYVGLARTLWQQQNELVEAIAVCRKALVVDPSFVSARFDLAVLLGATGSSDKAIAEYREVLRLAPDDSLARTNLFMLLQREKQLSEAIAEFREEVRCNPEDPEARLLLGYALLRHAQPRGLQSDAVKHLRVAVQRKAKDLHSAHIYLGDALLLEGKYTTAADAYREAVRLRGTSRGYWGLGMALAGQEKWAEAEKAFQRALGLGRGSRQERFDLIRVLLVQGKISEAEAIHKTALKARRANVERLRQNYAFAHMSAASSLMCGRKRPSRESAKRALRLLQQAESLDPASIESDRGYWIALGAAHYRTGDWKQAVVALRKSMQLGSRRDPATLFHFAMANWRLGNQPEARAALRKAIHWTKKKKRKLALLSRLQSEVESLMEVEKQRSKANPQKPASRSAVMAPKPQSR